MISLLLRVPRYAWVISAIVFVTLIVAALYWWNLPTQRDNTPQMLVKSLARAIEQDSPQDLAQCLDPEVRNAIAPFLQAAIELRQAKEAMSSAAQACNPPLPAPDPQFDLPADLAAQLLMDSSVRDLRKASIRVLTSERVEIRVNGDDILHARRVRGRWYVTTGAPADLSELRQTATSLIPVLAAQRQSYEQLTDEIKNGHIDHANYARRHRQLLDRAWLQGLDALAEEPLE